MYSFSVPFDSVLYSKSKLSRLCLLSYRSRLIAIYKKGFGVLAKLVRLLVVLAVSTLLDKNQTIWFPDTSLLGIWLFSGVFPLLYNFLLSCFFSYCISIRISVCCHVCCSGSDDKYGLRAQFNSLCAKNSAGSQSLNGFLAHYIWVLLWLFVDPEFLSL